MPIHLSIYFYFALVTLSLPITLSSYRSQYLSSVTGSCPSGLFYNRGRKREVDALRFCRVEWRGGAGGGGEGVGGLVVS